MEVLRRIAYEVVLRACGFGSLAIFCVMVGMSFEPRAAFQAGGFLTTLMALILYYKAREALTKDYRKTELWLYVPKELRPPKDYAQWVSSTVLRETYLTFAKWTSAIAIAMWVVALGFGLAGVTTTWSFEDRQTRALPEPSAAALKRDRAPPAIRYQVFPETRQPQ